MGTYPISLIYQDYWREKPEFVKPTTTDFRWMMFAIEDGHFAYTIDNIRGEATKGDLVICPPDAEFQRKALTPLSFHYFLFQFSEAAEPNAEARMIDLLRRLYSFKFTAREQDRLFNTYRQLNRLGRMPDKVNRQWQEHYANDIWMLFRMEIEHTARQNLLDEDRLMKEAKAIIDHHAFRDVRLKDIAARLHIHPVQLSRRFQRVFGMAPSHYLVSIRMEKAIRLLIETEYTIDHVAQLCGYENGFYFSRVFTHYSNMNPSQYRKLHSMASP
ncbi:hypothetical protein J31TS4_17040 [Paenibacillus sp. J31TS4]|uniref:AraC family transcriptional regulator n=1 Tax=Paenibacillus sp. J31TS4 TaxID=2807195 RepID=UPI001B22600D|nr:AraC family transcriptional regulator [Paenibacillus sp. J31TS4]GIP38424.1 hypothetical protein J31TS4_17040 [Paenibacillus sp. J31TS4]